MLSPRSISCLAIGAAVVFAGCASPDKQDGDSTTAGEVSPPPPTADAGTSSAPKRKVQDPRLTDIAFLKSQEPSAEIDIAIGNVFLHRGELDSALVYYRSAVDREPTSAAALNYVGICLARMGRLDEAEEAYQEALKADAFYVKTHVNLGNVYFRKDKLDKAVHAYEVAVSIDTTDATAWLNLGLAYEKVDRRQDAVLAYHQAARKDLTMAEPLVRLGWIYYDRKYYYEARVKWGEAVERDPSREDLKENIQRLLDYADSTGTR